LQILGMIDEEGGFDGKKTINETILTICADTDIIPGQFV